MTKKAFTLSEVMLVLSVIGVIAALTIPGLIQNLNDRQYKTLWKKDFSTISQAMRMVLDNEGSYNTFLTGYYNLAPELKKYVSISKDCNMRDCFYSATDPVFNYKDASGRAMSFSIFDNGQFILTNGAFVAIQNEGTTSNTYIFVDVNGYLKGPNVAGKDLFGIQVLADKFVPLGAVGSEMENSRCNSTNTALSSYSSPADGLPCSSEFFQN